MEELLWAAGAVAAVIAFRWWRRRNGEPPADGSPDVLPFRRPPDQPTSPGA